MILLLNIIKLIILFSSFVAIVLFLIFLLYCFLDSFYRPKQYPYHKLFDKYIPLIILFMPTIYTISFTQEIKIKLSLFLFLHILIIVLFIYWSKLRNWGIEENTINTWKSPKIFKQLSIALIYPYVFFIYFTFLRSLNLGTSINYSLCVTDFFFDYGIFILVYFLFFCYYFYYIFIILILSINNLRNFLWLQFIGIMYSIHLILLQFNMYFKFCSFLFKGIYVIDYYIGAKNPKIWSFLKNYSLILKLRDVLYFIPQIYTFLIFFFILCEILIFKQLSYSYYLLFFYPLIYGFIVIFSSFGKSNFISDTCFSDYIYCNWGNPRYPIIFWENFFNANEIYGFSYKFNDLQINYLITLAKRNSWSLRKKTSRLYHNLLLTEKVKHKSNCLKIKAQYKNWHGVRFYSTYDIHPKTLNFAQNILAKLSLINLNWSTFYNPIIQNNNKISIDPSLFYIKPIEVIPTPIVNTMRELVELNSLYHLGAVKNVELSLWKNEFNPTLKAKQQAPDIYINFIEKNFKVGVDMKLSIPKGLGHGIISPMSQTRYEKLLHDAFRILEQKKLMTPPMKNFFFNIYQANSINNFDQISILWAESLPYFTASGYLPPLRINNIINSTYFNQDIKNTYDSYTIYLQEVSNHLNKLKINTNISHYEFGAIINSSPELKELMEHLFYF